jgi:hypothetical protein
VGYFVKFFEHSPVSCSQVDDVKRGFSREKSEKVEMVEGVEMFVMLSVLVSYGVISFFWSEDFGVFAIVSHKISED